MSPDFLAVLEDELATARQTLARDLERVDALVALRSMAYALASKAPDTTLDSLLAAAEGEEERARLQSLLNRLTPEGASTC
ncbi:MAG: hypothetical protein ACR2G7_10550 [Acidimicrobiales bacterium]